MDNPQSDLDQEIKKTQLAAAQIDLQLKEQDLRNRPTFWKNVFTNPVVLGAIITAFIAVNTSIVGWMTSAQQRQLDAEKFLLQTQIDRAKFEGELILSAIRTGDPSQSMTNVEFLIQAGLIQDRDGGLHKFLSQRQRSLPQLPNPPTAPK
jgi:hypothetical protein